METSVVEILRAAELQRLRRIRQLGLVHLVYPGAEHSRFVHSIGAAHLALRFARQLEETSRDFLVPLLQPGPEAARDLALAALTHDIGHGPLSHVWEREVIGDDFDRSEWAERLGIARERFATVGKWHEMVGRALLMWPDGEIHNLLEQQDYGTARRIATLSAGEHYLRYLPALISSDVDVDRCDFILRDTYCSGVEYGRFDVNWLISTATIGRSTRGTLVVGFDSRKAPRVIVQFLTARHALYDTVYYHKTVRSAEGMIGLLLKRLRYLGRSRALPFAKVSEVNRVFAEAFSGSPLRPQEVRLLDDYSLWALVQSVSEMDDFDVTASDLAKKVLVRDLFKFVPCDQDRLARFLRRSDAYKLLHAAVQPYCAGDAEFYVHVDSAPFEMLSDRESDCVYLVDLNDPARPATPAREHLDIRGLWHKPEETVRLYVPREARDAVFALVAS